MSERSLERAESNWPLLHIAVAIIATFSSVTVLLWLLVIGLVALVLVTGGAMAVMNDGRARLPDWVTGDRLAMSATSSLIPKFRT